MLVLRLNVADHREDDMPGASAFGSEFLVNTTTTNDQYHPTIPALAPVTRAVRPPQLQIHRTLTSALVG